MLPSPAILDRITFAQAILLAPFAVLMHVFEEWPGFPRWARWFASPTYTDREYIITHVLAVVTAAVGVLLVRAFPNPIVLFAFFAIVFGPGIFCNAWFHVGASALSRSYCPGVVTGVLVYLPLSALLVLLGLREKVFSVTAVLSVLAFSAAVHTFEVGRNVFKRW